MKDPTFRGGFTKNQYRGDDCLKRAGGSACAQFGNLRGRGGLKERVVFFLGGGELIPQCTLCQGFYFS